MENPLILGHASPMGRPVEKGEGFPGQRIVVLPIDVVSRTRGHPLLASLLPTDCGFFPKAKGHRRARSEGATQAIFIYCAKGGGWCDMAGQSQEVRAGDLLVVPPETPHVYGAHETSPWTIHWFHVTGTKVAPLLSELGVTREQPVLFLGEDPQLLALFEELLAVMEQGYTPAHLLYAAQTLEHLIGVMIWHRGRRWRDQPSAEQKIALSIDYMKQHLDQPLTVRTLAAMSNLSASHYSAIFKDRTGYAPVDYFIRLRMHRACQLLDTTDLEVKSIAARVGYEDPLYFSRAFKSVNQVAPSEYRRRHKG